MKRPIQLLCLLLLLPASLALGAGSDRVLDVTTLMKNVGESKGAVSVEGVVARVYAKDHKFGLIDVEEYKRCNSVTCAGLVLPVTWNGPMPESKTTVRVKGEVRKNGGKLEFVANSVEKVPGDGK